MLSEGFKLALQLPTMQTYQELIRSQTPITCQCRQKVHSHRVTRQFHPDFTLLLQSDLHRETLDLIARGSRRVNVLMEDEAAKSGL
jgi:hypothetical protein